MVVNVDVRSFTPDEWQTAADVTGRTPADMLEDMDDDTVAVLTWLTVARDDPTVTLEDVRGQLEVDDTVPVLPQWPPLLIAHVAAHFRLPPSQVRQWPPQDVADVVTVLGLDGLLEDDEEADDGEG